MGDQQKQQVLSTDLPQTVPKMTPDILDPDESVSELIFSSPACWQALDSPIAVPSVGLRGQSGDRCG